MLKIDKQDNEYQFKQYGYRIAITLIFSVLAFVNGMCWVTVSPISIPVGRAYGESDAVVSIIPMCYMVTYVLVNFPSNWVLDVKGIKKGIVIGAVLTAVGAGFRCLITTHFAFVIIGQILCAIAQPFILNAPTKIAVRWFLPKSRSVALAILSVANIIGTAVGFLLPPLFVQDDATNSKIQSEFTALLLFQFFAALVPATMVLLWFRQKPPTPASLGATAEHTEYFKGVKMLFHDRRFLALNYSFGTVMGSFCIYGSLMDNILDCYGFSTDQVSYLAATMMITGIISAGIFGAYIQNTLNYRRVFIILGILGLMQCVALPALLIVQGYNFIFAVLIVILQGLVFIPLMPLSFDYGCDVLFPAGEAQITGCLMTSGNFLGVIFIIFSQQVFGLGAVGNTTEQNQTASLNTVILVGAFTVTGVLMYFFFNSELKRSKYQKGNSDSLLSST